MGVFRSGLALESVAKSPRKCASFEGASVLNGTVWMNETASSTFSKSHKWHRRDERGSICECHNVMSGTVSMNATALSNITNATHGAAWVNETAFANAVNVLKGTTWMSETDFFAPRRSCRKVCGENVTRCGGFMSNAASAIVCFDTSVSFQPYPIRHPGHVFRRAGPLVEEGSVLSPLWCL